MIRKLAIFLLGLGFSVSVSAAVWMWTDDEGKVHYSDYPEVDNAVLVEIESAPTDRAAVAETRKKAVALERERQKGESLLRKEKADDSAQQKEDRQLAKANCEKAKTIYDSYYSAPRLYKPTADGGREYLSSEQTDALRAKAQASIDEWCG